MHNKSPKNVKNNPLPHQFVIKGIRQFSESKKCRIQHKKMLSFNELNFNGRFNSKRNNKPLYVYLKNVKPLFREREREREQVLQKGRLASWLNTRMTNRLI